MLFYQSGEEEHLFQRRLVYVHQEQGRVSFCQVARRKDVRDNGPAKTVAACSHKRYLYFLPAAFSHIPSPGLPGNTACSTE